MTDDANNPGQLEELDRLAAMPVDDADALWTHVREYFVSLGAQECQIERTYVNAASTGRKTQRDALASSHQRRAAAGQAG